MNLKEVLDMYSDRIEVCMNRESCYACVMSSSKNYGKCCPISHDEQQGFIMRIGPNRFKFNETNYSTNSIKRYLTFKKVKRKLNEIT